VPIPPGITVSVSTIPDFNSYLPSTGAAVSVVAASSVLFAAVLSESLFLQEVKAIITRKYHAYFFIG